MVPSQRSAQAIEVELRPNKEVNLKIESLPEDQAAITDIINELVGAAIDNAYLVHEKLRDFEDEEQALILERTTEVEVVVKTTRRKPNRSRESK